MLENIGELLKPNGYYYALENYFYLFRQDILSQLSKLAPVIYWDIDKETVFEKI